MDAVRDLDIFMVARLSTSNQKKLEMLSKHFKDSWRVVVNITKALLIMQQYLKPRAFQHDISPQMG